MHCNKHAADDTGLCHVQVLVNGCNVREMDVHEVRGQVGLVSQEPVLFSCSVRDNIVYGKPEASQQQVEEAARAANAHNFIQKLPEGYDTQVSRIGASHRLCVCCPLCSASLILPLGCQLHMLVSRAGSNVASYDGWKLSLPAKKSAALADNSIVHLHIISFPRCTALLSIALLHFV